MKNRFFFLGLALGLMSAGGYSQNAAPAPQKPPIVLDVKTGEIMGAQMGMDEATVTSALKAKQDVTVNRVEYNDRFLLQVPQVPGLVFNFRGNKELDDIYTNNPRVLLSNGLRVGLRTQEFLSKLGQPKASTRLASGAGVELTFFMGDFELGVIVMDSSPYVAKALTVRKVDP